MTSEKHTWQTACIGMDVALAPEDETRDSVSRMSALDLYEDLLIDEDKDDENRVFTMQEVST